MMLKICLTKIFLMANLLLEEIQMWFNESKVKSLAEFIYRQGSTNMKH